MNMDLEKEIIQLLNKHKNRAFSIETLSFVLRKEKRDIWEVMKRLEKRKKVMFHQRKKVSFWRYRYP